MRVHFHEKCFGPSAKVARNVVYSGVSGRRFRKDSKHTLDEATYGDFLESLPKGAYTILDGDQPVERAPEPVQTQTLAEADELRKASDADAEILAKKTELTPAEKAKITREKNKQAQKDAEAANKKTVEDGKKSKSIKDLRDEVLGTEE